MVYSNSTVHGHSHGGSKFNSIISTHLRNPGRHRAPSVVHLVPLDHSLDHSVSSLYNNRKKRAVFNKPQHRRCTSIWQHLNFNTIFHSLMENCRKLEKKKNSLKTYHWYQKRFLHTCITPKAVEDNWLFFYNTHSP